MLMYTHSATYLILTSFLELLPVTHGIRHSMLVNKTKIGTEQNTLLYINNYMKS